MEEISGMDAVILSVAHNSFAGMDIADMNRLFSKGKKVLLDLKGLFSRKDYETAGYSYWRL